MGPFYEERDRDLLYTALDLVHEALERGLMGPEAFGQFINVLQLAAHARRVAARCDELAREFPFRNGHTFDEQVERLQASGGLRSWHIPFPLPLVVTRNLSDEDEQAQYPRLAVEGDQLRLDADLWPFAGRRVRVTVEVLE